MIGHTKSSPLQHRQVVCPISHGDGLLEANALSLGQGQQQICLALSVNDFANDLSRHDPIHHFEPVSKHIVDT
tara:strand:+ start:782 stop:1000 length:219 start_codon:yes stop_codon:yes gene_type:complete